MKYSVGDIFISHFGKIMVIIRIAVPSSGEIKMPPYYTATIDGRTSYLRWYDKDFDCYKNITCPVLKELYS